MDAYRRVRTVIIDDALSGRRQSFHRSPVARPERMPVASTLARPLVNRSHEVSPMTLARIEMVLRLVGGVVAALGVAEIERNVFTPVPQILVPWPYLLTIIIGTGAVLAFVVAFALTPMLTTRPFLWAV